MADPSYWSRMAIVGRAVLVISFAVVAVVACVVFILVCIKKWWQSARMRLFMLGGVTTLRGKLNYPCTMCRDSMEAGEKVRTLSCNHVFHCGGTVTCELGIDQWLRTGPTKPCPMCRKVPHPVLPWKRPPPSSPAPSPEASAPALPHLPRTSSTPDLEEALLPPAHDETPPEASSSASAPPLAQLPRTSTPDIEVALPIPADDEILFFREQA